MDDAELEYDHLSPVIYFNFRRGRSVMDDIMKSYGNVTFASFVINLIKQAVIKKVVPAKVIRIITPY
jgi:hypothetical protein